MWLTEYCREICIICFLARSSKSTGTPNKMEVIVQFNIGDATALQHATLTSFDFARDENGLHRGNKTSNNYKYNVNLVMNNISSEIFC